jgi:nucleoside-diphosphate-sugar epimerase
MNPTESKPFVTGGTGMLGAHLLQQLTAAGEQVIALKRDSSSLRITEKVFAAYSPDPQKHWQQITWVTGDVTDYFSLEEGMVGADKIFHAAGYISMNKKDRHKLEKINVEGTANIVNAALHLGIKRLVHVSSVTALGQAAADGELISEKTPWKNSPLNTHYAVTKQAGEREVWRGSEEGLDVLVFHPGLIVGHGDWDSGTGRMIKALADGLAFYTGGVNGWVDVRDVARALIYAEGLGLSGERFILSAENKSLKSAFDELCDLFGSRKPYLRAGKGLLNLAATFESVKCFFTGGEPLVTRESALTACLKSAYDNSKLISLTDFRYTPLRDTFREVVERYRADQA